MSHQTHIALFIEQSHAFCRELVGGVARFASHHGRWAIYMPYSPCWQKLDELVKSNIAGIIARPSQRSDIESILKIGLPAVNLGNEVIDDRIPLIEPDWYMVAQNAVSHFRDRGFEHMAFLGDKRSYVLGRLQAYKNVLAEEGLPCVETHLLPAEWGPDRMDWHDLLIDLRKWLNDLPKPVGILAANDLLGRQITEASKDADLRIPEEIAVLGIHNDSILCAMSDPPLSSIPTDAERIGYQAAALLARMIDGEAPPAEPIRIPPRDVVVRQSTEVFNYGDRVVADAARFIRQNIRKMIGVSDVAEAVGMSRRALELRFRKATGRTVWAVITQKRVARAKHLLRDTDWSMSDVARESGFKDAVRLCKVFTRATGQAPTTYRQSFTNSYVDG